MQELRKQTNFAKIDDEHKKREAYASHVLMVCLDGLTVWYYYLTSFMVSSLLPATYGTVPAGTNLDADIV